jgi:hypothetical protein
MSDISESITSLSIARHTVQLILRSALDAEPMRCFGLIGRKNESTISHTAPLAIMGIQQSAAHVLKNCDLQHILERWDKQSVVPCGLYFTTENGELPQIKELESYEKALTSASASLPGSALIHMPLMLNTAGCLEAFTYQLHENALVSIPLTLEEDGQRMDSRQRTVNL